MGGHRMAQGLGWFSVGLGVPQLLAPERMSRFIGLAATPGTTALMRAVGVQELTVGTGVLRRDRPAALLWTRVFGDLLHLALLGSALAADNNARSRVRRAAWAVAGVGATDVVAAIRVTRAAVREPTRVTTAITVNRPAGEVYAAWRDFEQLPRFLYHLESVRAAGPGRWRWVARAPGKGSVEWDAEVVEERPGRRLTWRSVGTGDVATAGTVEFAPAPGGRGTEVTLDLEYVPPGGRAGKRAARLLGEAPKQQVREDLRRFKQVMEAGEVVRSDGSPEGATSHRQRKQRPARPAA